MSRYRLTGRTYGRFTREVCDTKNGKLRIMKGPFHTSSEECRFSHEARVLSDLNIEGVVGLRHCLRTPRRCWLIMERLPGSSLDNQVVPLERVGWLVAKLAHVLGLCHQRGWSHSDICPANVQSDGQHVWLLDFGASLPLGNHYPLRRQVRPHWSHQTLLQGTGRVTETDDVYSLLLLSCSLFTRKNSQERNSASWASDRWSWLRPGRLSRRQWGFLRRGLEKPGSISMQDITFQALGW